MKCIFSLLFFATLFFFGSAQTTIDEIINDMILPHEGLPHGIPANFNWQAKPRVGAAEPGQGWTAAIAWGQVYEWAGGNTATNTRIQIKDLAMYYLSKKDNQWHLLQSAVRVAGANYVEDFAGDVNKPASIRVETGGSISTTCGNGYNFHFWPNTGRIKIPENDVAGCYVTVKARLIVNDANLPDDRDKAKFLMSVGGDWWQSLTAVWDNWKTNWDIGIGRFRFITPEWKSFSMYSVPADTIRSNPPPFDVSITGNILLKKFENVGFKTIKNKAGTMVITINNPQNERITLEVFDINGHRLETLANNLLNAENNSYNWNNSSQKPGIYLFKLSSAYTMVTKKVIIIQ